MYEEDDNDSDIFEEMDRTFHSILQDTFSDMHSSFFDLQARSLKPLYRIEVDDDEVRVIFDLPWVEKQDISLTSTEETLSIEARMKKPVSLRVGGAVQKRFEFEKYSKKIRLPVKVNPEGASAKFGHGMLVVRYPIVHRGSAVEIG